MRKLSQKEFDHWQEEGGMKAIIYLKQGETVLDVVDSGGRR